MQRTLTNRSVSDKARGVVIGLIKKEAHPVGAGAEAEPVKGFSLSPSVCVRERNEDRAGGGQREASVTL